MKSTKDIKNEKGKHILSVTTYDVDTQAITDGPYIFEKSKLPYLWLILAIVGIFLLLLITFTLFLLKKMLSLFEKVCLFF